MVQNMALQKRSSRANVVAKLRKLIATGYFLDGSPLPAERLLSNELMAARGTVRSALTILEEQGLLQRGPGRIRYVRCIRGQRVGILNRTIAVITRISLLDHNRITPTSEQRQLHDTFLSCLDERGFAALFVGYQRWLETKGRDLIRIKPAGVAVICDATWDENEIACLHLMRNEGIPFVVFGNAPALHAFDRISPDHASGSRDVTQWLISQGCRRILRFWVGHKWWLDERDAGYKQAITEAGLEEITPLRIPCLPETGNDREAFTQRMRIVAGFLPEYLTDSQPIDGLLVTTDGYAYIMAAALRLFGKVPNRDIWIGGYDHYWWPSPDAEFEPCGAAVTIDKRYDRIAAAMIDLLQERMDGRLPMSPQLRLVKGDLIELHSVKQKINFYPTRCHT